MKNIFVLFFAAAILLGTGCTSTHKTMREPNARIEFELDDFELSPQFTAEASSTKIIGIDWQRLTNSETGAVQGAEAMFIDFASIPVLGTFAFDLTSNYALYQLMVDHPGYDVVLYPQYETVVSKPILGIGWFKKETTVVVTARLGKLKK